LLSAQPHEPLRDLGTGLRRPQSTSSSASSCGGDKMSDDAKFILGLG